MNSALHMGTVVTPMGDDVEERDFDAELALLLALAEQQGTLSGSLAATEWIAPVEAPVRISISNASTELQDADS